MKCSADTERPSRCSFGPPRKRPLRNGQSEPSSALWAGFVQLQSSGARCRPVLSLDDSLADQHHFAADRKGGIGEEPRVKTKFTQTAAQWGVYNVETDEARAILNVHPFPQRASVRRRQRTVRTDPRSSEHGAQLAADRPAIRTPGLSDHHR
jgi:hypothetical protein